MVNQPHYYTHFSPVTLLLILPMLPSLPRVTRIDINSIAILQYHHESHHEYIANSIPTALPLDLLFTIYTAIPCLIPFITLLTIPFYSPIAYSILSAICSISPSLTLHVACSLLPRHRAVGVGTSGAEPPGHLLAAGSVTDIALGHQGLRRGGERWFNDGEWWLTMDD